MDRILAPAPFLQTAGTPPVDWQTWKETFEAYLEAIEGDTFTAKKKKALLIYNLGTEGRKIPLPLEMVSSLTVDEDGVESTSTVDEYASIISTLDKRFNPRKNIVLERHKFLQRTQIPGESIDDFVVALVRW
ncbi:hypothetical protein NDU88_007165 [Pleurodeles waltl]|uniref:Uncharacterized protein n=1 Tax=Pleurodeles waltl TaxID=8319 RepID=A0AAV7N3A6_PLEWA|nr:hypothetical protein NDU88_007165 [Pleurodeles waltl]